jgi:hypothetical protein
MYVSATQSKALGQFSTFVYRAAPSTSNSVDIPEGLKSITDQAITAGEYWSAAQSSYVLLLKATQLHNKKKITSKLKIMQELLQATRRLTTGAENTRTQCRTARMDPLNLRSCSASDYETNQSAVQAADD